MTFDQIALLILCFSLAAGFLVRRAPIDLIAIIGLLIACFLGLVPADKVFSGFSSAAVVTMVAVFFIGAAMRSSGANEACGNLIFALSKGRPRIGLLLIVLVSGFVSSFMNNVAAVALMLPVTIVLAQRLNISASQLLIPMSFGAVLGGMTTVMGTPPNLIAAEIYASHGFHPLNSIDFISSGLLTLITGALVLYLFAPKLLPRVHNNRPPQKNPELEKLYEILNHAYAVRIPGGSPLVGRTLAEIGATAALDAQVVAVIRETETVLAPMPDFRFKAEDLAVLGGEQDDLILLKNFTSFEPIEHLSSLNPSFSAYVGALVSLKDRSIEWTSERLEILSAENNLLPLFIKRGLNTIAWKDSKLDAKDQILVLGSKDSLDQLRQSQSMTVEVLNAESDPLLSRSIFALTISDLLSNDVLKACDLLSQRLGMRLLAVQREEKLIDVERRAIQPQKGDVLLFLGEARKIQQFKDLLSVEAVSELPKFFLNSADIGVSEVVLSPRSKLVGQSLADLNFRERYGFRVLSVWREGSPIFQRLAHEQLRFGDALLLLGPKQHLELLRDDPDFLVLTSSPSSKIVPWKIGIVALAAVLLAVLPILEVCSVPIAAVISACLVCLLGVVRIAEAYRQVEWRVVFFTAALLPLSYALDSTGFSAQVAGLFDKLIGAQNNPYVLILCLGIFSSLVSQLLDGPVAVLLLTPIGIGVAKAFHFSPEPFVLMIAQAASITFLFPISHKAHLLVLGPGSYRTRDFLRIGFIVSIVSFIALAISITAFHPL